MRKLTLNEVSDIVKANGYTLLSKKYINYDTKLKVLCPFGHMIKIKLGNIKRKQCLECKRIKVGNDKRINGIDVAYEVAKNKNGKCLSVEYINNRTKMKWECYEGHQWEANLNSIKDSNKWCPYCAGNVKLSLSVAHKIARRKNGKCLSKEYKNAHQKLYWECAKKHQWNANLDHVKGGDTWCPICRSSKNQDKILSIIKEIFYNYKVFNNYRGFDWLRTKNTGKQELDIWVPKIKLAIEYDGEQHFQAIDFFGGKRALIKRKKLDRIKDEKIIQHSDDVKYFLRLNYKDNINKESICIKLKEMGIL